MEPLTHTLTGIALGRAGLNRKLPGGTALLALAAAAPDIDVVTSFWGSTAYLHYPRHLTHALVMLPLMALLPVALMALVFRKGYPWKRAYLLALIGVGSHIAIDWTNSYGVRPFLPFSERWYSLDAFSLYDLWLWAVLLAAALLPLLARLVSSEIGARPGSGRGLGVFALVFFAGLGLWRYLLHERAVAVLESRLYQGVAPARVAAFPNRADPWRWRGLIETPGFYSLHTLDLREEFDPSAGRVFFRTEPSPAEAAAWEAARRTQAFEVFLQFARYPFRRFRLLDEPEAGLRVEVMDLRFGDPASEAFSATAEVGPDGRLRWSGFAFRPARPRGPAR